MRTRVETVRWGDRIQGTWVLNQPFQTAELCRIKAPFPTVWRIWATMVIDNANRAAGTLIAIIVNMGIGSTVITNPIQMFSDVPVSFEVPAQTLWVTANGANSVANPGLFVAQVHAAPVVPWEGIAVEVLE